MSEALVPVTVPDAPAPPADPPVLLVPGRATSTALLLAGVARGRGMEVRGVVGEAALAGLGGRAVYWYGGPVAADRGAVAVGLGVGLLEPADGWLPSLPRELTGRAIRPATLAQAWAMTSAAFVKPPSAKSFPAAVYADGRELARATGELPPETAVLISDPVEFAAEFRLFTVDGQVVTGSRYASGGRLDVAPLEGEAREADVRRFAGAVLAASAHPLPGAVALDVGLLRDPAGGPGRWAVVEANMAWYAHSYAASADAVLDCVLRAAGPYDQVLDRDRPFLRG